VPYLPDPNPTDLPESELPAEEVVTDPFPVDGLVISQYEVAEYDSNSEFAEVTYTDDQGYVYKRNVNIPKTEDGEIDEDYFQTVLYEQLLGVNHKRSVGVAVFKDPNAPDEEDEVTEES